MESALQIKILNHVKLKHNANTVIATYILNSTTVKQLTPLKDK